MDYTTLDDPSLVRLLAYKHADALSVLYDRYGKLVFSLAVAIVNDRNAAEEVTQDVFWRVWNHAAIYDQTQANFRSWLTRITRNRAIDALRQQRIRPEYQALDWTDPALKHLADHHSPSHAVALQMQQEQVRSALAQLPQDQQEAVTLAFLQGYTHHEIAQRLQQPLGTIKTRVRLSMQKLQHLLQNNHQAQSNIKNPA